MANAPKSPRARRSFHSPLAGVTPAWRRYADKSSSPMALRKNASSNTPMLFARSLTTIPIAPKQHAESTTSATPRAVLEGGGIATEMVPDLVSAVDTAG